jgi:hypothetical protein
MSVLSHLRSLSLGERPGQDALLGAARCAWGAGELVGEEAILAGFVATPFAIDEETVAVETSQSAALIGDGRALVADLYGGRIGRLWRIGALEPPPAERSVDVPFDPDMRQARGDLCFREGDHPELAPEAVTPLMDAIRGLVERERSRGRLRVRAFTVRAFGNRDGSAALVSLFTLGNESVRTAGFSYAAVYAAPAGARAVADPPPSRSWTPRL